MDNTRTDFLVQYKTISNKLKKRFLRKPNVAEASEQFSLLTKDLQRQECPHYAAFCCLAVARCERTLGNGVGETQALLQSGRLFLEAERQNQRLLCPSFGEHLVGALSCYSGALKALSDQKQTSLAAALCLELGEELRSTTGLLTKDLQRQECPHYAAFCCLAVARCERTLGNGVGETQALLQSGRLFLEAERQNQRLLCPSFGEHLVGALSCYSGALKALSDQKQTSLAAALCLELGEELRSTTGGHSLLCFQAAAQLQSQCTVDYLSALEKVASCKLDSGDFDGALNVLTEMYVVAQEKVSTQNTRPLGILNSYLMDTEVTRLLLLLLLEPPFQKLRHEDSQTLQKYTLDPNEPEVIDIYQNEDLFLLLQSLVMACQTKELDVLKSLQKELWPLLSAQQNMILQRTLSRLSESTA